jgi:signal transduction histidine kinase/CheY-like chemotaxis protein
MPGLNRASGLSTKILAATVLAVVVLGLTLVTVMILFMNSLTDRILLETLQPTAKTAALSVEGSLRLLADRFFLIRDRVSVSGPRGPEEKQAALERIMGGIEFVWLGLYENNGALQAGSSRSPPDIGGWGLYSMMAETENLAIADTVVSPQGLEIVMGIPVTAEGRISAYLAGSYKYDVLNDVLSNIIISAGSTAFIVNQEGKLMAHRDPKRVRGGEGRFGEEPALRDIFSQMNQGKTGAARVVRGGSSTYIAYAPIRGTRWSLVIETPREDFMFAARQGVLTCAALTAVLLVFFAMASNAVLRKTLTRPLHVIAENARALAAGRFTGELPPALVNRRDEIGRLGAAFITMYDSVGAVIRSIEDINDAARAGSLLERADLSPFQGDYLRIVRGINTTLELICSQFDAVPEALALFNEKREMLYHNRAMEEFLVIHGLSRRDPRLLEQIAGGGEEASGEDGLAPRAAAIFDPRMESPGAFTADIALLGDNGGDNFVLNLQRAGKGGGGNSGGKLCVMLLLSDVTMLTRAKIDAEAASQAKGDFLSRMSHEIRTPMNAVIGMTQIAKSSDDIAKIRGCLDQVESSSTHLLGVINDILDFSKIEAGKLSLDETEFSLPANMDFVVSVMSPRAREKKIDLLLKLGTIVNDAVTAESLRLNQVLLNLLSNAVKFSPEGSGVELRAEERESGGGLSVFSFEVADRGIGISAANAEKLFKPFEQADGGITRKYGGTGLGLVIAKSLVEMMGGEISLQSEEGRGSTFSFTIRCPARPGEESRSAAAAPAPGEEAPAFDFSGKRCLVVDDIEINREIILELLSGTGLEMETAGNGEEAAAKFREAPPGHFDVILMDMQMPVMDGCTATRQIRAAEEERRRSAGTPPDRPPRGIPVIAMTANVMEEDVKRAREAGMNAHLGKPIEIQSIFAVLRDFLGAG